MPVSESLLATLIQEDESEAPTTRCDPDSLPERAIRMGWERHEEGERDVDRHVSVRWCPWLFALSSLMPWYPSFRCGTLQKREAQDWRSFFLLQAERSTARQLCLQSAHARAQPFLKLSWPFALSCALPRSMAARGSQDTFFETALDRLPDALKSGLRSAGLDDPGLLDNYPATSTRL